MDVTDSEAVEAVAETVEHDFGAIDVLVNCAGIGMPSPGAESVSDELWRRHMQVNLDGTFYCCRSFGKRMLGKGRGAIVNIGSMSGVIGQQAAAPVILQRFESRCASSDTVPRRRVGRPGCPRQRSGTNLHRNADDSAKLPGTPP